MTVRMLKQMIKESDLKDEDEVKVQDCIGDHFEIITACTKIRENELTLMVNDVIF